MLETVLPDDPAGLAPLVTALGFKPGLPPVAARVAPSKRAKLLASVSALGLTAGQLDTMKTWLAAIALGDGAIGQLGYTQADGVEATLTARFRAAHKPVVGLETPESQLRIFDSLPETDARALLDATVDDVATAREDTNALLAYWQAGETEALAAEFDKGFKATPTLERALLTARNRAWADWIAARLTVPGTVFLAVGAGHLGGANSVVALLRAKGLTVERLPVDLDPRARPGGAAVAQAGGAGVAVVADGGEIVEQDLAETPAAQSARCIDVPQRAGVDEGAAPAMGEAAAALERRVRVVATCHQRRAERQRRHGQRREAADRGAGVGALDVARRDEQRRSDARRVVRGCPARDRGAAQAVGNEHDRDRRGGDRPVERRGPVAGQGIVPLGLAQHDGVAARRRPDRLPVIVAGAAEAGDEDNLRTGHRRLLVCERRAGATPGSVVPPPSRSRGSRESRGARRPPSYTPFRQWDFPRFA